MNILVAIDSFKGTLTSSDLSILIKEHFSSQGHQVKVIPISDGGEGFVESIRSFLDCPLQSYNSYGPLMDPIHAEYILHESIAFIELHATSGITKISKKRLNPMRTTTYGLGELIRFVIEKGATKVVMGLGGSATNDGGAGMLQALGVLFYKNGKLINEPMNGELIGSVDSLDLTQFKNFIRGVKFEIASDVNNPLLGLTGSAHIFSMQKGATHEQINELELHMAHYADIVESTLNISKRYLPGAGAAGGVGFAALSFLNAHLHSGIGYMIDLLDIEEQVIVSDVVIVGEGRLDHQTCYGKAPFGIAAIAKKHNKKVMGLFGSISYVGVLDNIDEVYSVVPKYATELESLENPAYHFCQMLKHLHL